MIIVLEYKDGIVEELHEMPRLGHKFNGNRPTNIITTGVEKFDETGRCLTSEYSLLINLLEKNGTVVATELKIVYDEILGRYMYYRDNMEKKYHKFIVAKKDKEEFERLHNNLVVPKWYIETK